MPGLKSLYKKRKELIKKQALEATRLKEMQDEMELHAPYLHQMTYDLMPEDIKAEFEAMGRGNDSEIRKIDGKPAHVTPGEASLIDNFGKEGEKKVKDIGSGTINPNTGLKEYNPEELTPDEYFAMTDDELEQYLSDWGISDDYKSYIRSRDPYAFDLLQDELDLQRKHLSENLEFDKAQLASSFSTGVLGAAAQSRIGLRDVMSQSAKMQGRTGLAGSGTITSEMNRKALDAMRSLDQTQGFAQSKYGLGLEGSERTYGQGLETADLAYSTGMHSEKVTQLNKLYEDIGLVDTMMGDDESGGSDEGFFHNTWRPSQGHWGVIEDIGQVTHCCTAANKYHNFSTRKVKELRVWHRKQSQIWQKGYDVWGKIIADNLVKKYKFGGKLNEQFYQWVIKGNKSLIGLLSFLIIGPMSYMIGTYSYIKALFRMKKLIKE